MRRPYFYFGGRSPGDDSHSLMWEAVSAIRALRISFDAQSLVGYLGLLYAGAGLVPLVADLRGRSVRNGVVPWRVSIPLEESGSATRRSHHR